MKTYEVTMARQENRIIVYTITAEDEDAAEEKARELFDEEDFDNMRTVVADEWVQQVDECEGLSSCG